VQGHTNKYLMWKVIPVQFCKDGEWQVVASCPICKSCLTGIAVGLLKVNAAIERLTDYRIRMHVPLVPVAKSPHRITL
jgi:hypothetical protein